MAVLLELTMRAREISLAVPGEAGVALSCPLASFAPARERLFLLWSRTKALMNSAVPRKVRKFSSIRVSSLAVASKSVRAGVAKL